MADDLIRKSDVLETYAELYDIFDDNKAIQEELHKVFDKINDIPTVEPNSSEKPNNSTISKMEQVDKDINVRSKDEPQTDDKCKGCKWWNKSYGCHWKEGVCHYVPKAIIPQQCVSCDSASRIIEAYSRGFDDGANTIKQTFVADGIVFAKMDEPQTDTEIAKAIVHKMIDDAVIAEDAYPDLRQKMHDAVDEYEPQTDCAWK